MTDLPHLAEPDDALPMEGSALPPEPVTADTVAEALRHRIQNNELEPGEWLREARVCHEFGIGRSIARRALRILAEDGLVDIEENRGACVSATTVEEVFDLYEIRAALYGLAARFACLRASDEAIAAMLVDIDRMLDAADHGTPAEQIIEISEKIFSEMASYASSDARKMVASVRRKTRFHFSFVALSLNANRTGPFAFWRDLRAALIARDPEAANKGAQDILHFMQGEVSRIMLSHGQRGSNGRFGIRR
jgi:DNA-binding GntR family transcriptional regulator